MLTMRERERETGGLIFRGKESADNERERERERERDLLFRGREIADNERRRQRELGTRALGHGKKGPAVSYTHLTLPTSSEV